MTYEGGGVESRHARFGMELTVECRTEAAKQPELAETWEGATTPRAGVAPGPPSPVNLRRGYRDVRCPGLRPKLAFQGT